MKIPRFLLPPLLRLHAWAMTRPYFDLPGYMERGWLVGYHSADRNRDNEQWHGRTLGTVHAWVTSRIAARAHNILRSDRDRARHCHPVDSVSVVLDRGYWEVCKPTLAAECRPITYKRLVDDLAFEQPGRSADMYASFGIFWRAPGSIVFRRAEDAHRIVLPIGTVAKTFWIIGRRRRGWGFWPEGKFVPWRQYLGLDA